MSWKRFKTCSMYPNGASAASKQTPQIFQSSWQKFIPKCIDLQLSVEQWRRAPGDLLDFWGMQILHSFYRVSISYKPWIKDSVMNLPASKYFMECHFCRFWTALLPSGFSFSVETPWNFPPTKKTTQAGHRHVLRQAPMDLHGRSRGRQVEMLPQLRRHGTSILLVTGKATKEEAM